MKLGRLLAAALVALTVLLAASGSVVAGPDPGFGSQGTALTASGTFPFSVVADGQDRTVVAGFNGQAGFVERLTAAGVADSGFGTNGTVAFANQVPSVAADSQDRLLVAGGPPAS